MKRSKHAQKLIDKKMYEILKPFSRSPLVAFFVSSAIFTFIICFPRISVIPIIFFSYLYLQSLPQAPEIVKIEKPATSHKDMLSFLDLRDLDQTQKQDQIQQFFDALNNEYFPREAATNETSHKYVVDLLKQIITAPPSFNFDNWLKKVVVDLLPKGTDDEFKSFVTHDVDKIADSCESTDPIWSKYLKLAVKTTPQVDRIPSNFSDKKYSYPEHYDRILKFPLYSEERYYRSEYDKIDAKKLWILIHGDASFFISYDYSKWYSQNTKEPYWLIPFALYRWWTPNEHTDEDDASDEEICTQGFKNKFADFISFSRTIHENTRKRMKEDILFWFLLSYIENQKIHQNPSANVSQLSRVFAYINDKLLAYYIAALVKSEHIITFNESLYEDIVIQCVDYILKRQTLEWTFAALVLQREILHSEETDHSYQVYQQRLRNLLDFCCNDIPKQRNLISDDYFIKQTQLTPDETKLLNHDHFKLEESYLFEVKGEKLIRQAINNQISVKESFKQFSCGIHCLLKANKVERIIDVLMDYCLLTIEESGTGSTMLKNEHHPNYLTIYEIYDEVKKKLANDQQMNETISKSDNYLILEAIANDDLDDKARQKASNILKKKEWKTYNLRRFICSLLMRKPKWRPFLKGIDASSLDEIATYEDEDLSNYISQFSCA